MNTNLWQTNLLSDPAPRAVRHPKYRFALVREHVWARLNSCRIVIELYKSITSLLQNDCGMMSKRQVQAANQIISLACSY